MEHSGYEEKNAANKQVGNGEGDVPMHFKNHFSTQSKEKWEAQLFDPEATEVIVPVSGDDWQIVCELKETHSDGKTEWVQLKAPKTITVVDKHREQKEVFKRSKDPIIGKGSYGCVVAYQNGNRVFCAKISSENESSIVKLLSENKTWCQEIRMRDCSLGGSPRQFLYIMPKMDGSLRDFVRNQVVEDVVRWVEAVRQQVVCLLDVTNNIPYMDLKPANVLYRRNRADRKKAADVHIGDLGSLVPDTNRTVAATFPPPEFRDGRVPVPTDTEKAEKEDSPTEEGSREDHPSSSEKAQDDNEPNSVSACKKLLAWSVGMFLLTMLDYAFVCRNFRFSSQGTDEEFKKNIAEAQTKLQNCNFPEEVYKLISYNSADRPDVSRIRIQQVLSSKKRPSDHTENPKETNTKKVKPNVGREREEGKSMFHQLVSDTANPSAAAWN